MAAAARVVGTLAIATFALPGLAGEHFPLAGTYTENQVCRGNESDSNRVKITAREIDSVFGLCTILSIKRQGATFVVHVECRGQGGALMIGDVNFTPRDDNMVDVSGQDQTYKATLYKCQK